MLTGSFDAQRLGKIKQVRDHAGRRSRLDRFRIAGFAEVFSGGGLRIAFADSFLHPHHSAHRRGR
ncbi:MAG: hypothetical protein MZW92_07085 [Comamonadaceae bacterium]|nr:hypothetical protein [Comamonadaceae bacterium]